MAFSKALPFVAMLIVVLPMVAMADIDGNMTAFHERLCQEVDCGMGTCVGDISYPLGYKCQCQTGWKQTQYDDDFNDEHKFLPCVIPNCTLNYGSCQPAPPPAPQKAVPRNSSFFDPCYWMYCGDGTCTNNGTYRYRCSCNSGFSNLLSTSYYPCYSQCTLGSDCAEIIRVANSTSDGTGTETGNGTTPDGDPASTILPLKFHWIIILVISMLMALK
ncbi:PREDICTED: neurogenic locus notch homolog protein 2-like [Populus euphratica]|uniref:Neurogenic locus notch homolog protein 2-like n=1 Tax=Populus euphratica TaxID=75702 RepID=A0AAJ6UNE0_POPEU|nr:PREDICTED: neurogenic locus notch homolog protein 2-like [Populus euphratica]